MIYKFIFHLFLKVARLSLASLCMFCGIKGDMIKYTVPLILGVCLFGCQSEPAMESKSQVETPPAVETIPLDEHNRLLTIERARTESLKNELSEKIKDAQENALQNEEIISALELQIEELENLVTEYRLQVSESKSSLKELKKIGSQEYKEIYERAKSMDHKSAILLYEEFLEEFPDSPISSRAKSRIRSHESEIQIISNRKNARPIRLWEAKLKGEGMFVRAVSEDILFELIGRKPDSSKRGSSSEYKERIYTWRDYVLDGGYRNLVIETTDGKIEQISIEE